MLKVIMLRCTEASLQHQFNSTEKNITLKHRDSYICKIMYI